MKYIKIVIIVAFGSLYGCVWDRKPDAQGFLINNESEEDIYIFSSQNDFYQDYDRTVIENDTDDLYAVKSHTQKILHSRPENWDMYTSENPYENRMRIFIVNKKLLKRWVGIKFLKIIYIMIVYY